jgi:hypothetical protein
LISPLQIAITDVALAFENQHGDKNAKQKWQLFCIDRPH